MGRIERGTIKQNQEIAVCNYHDAAAAPKKAKAPRPATLNASMAPSISVIRRDTSFSVSRNRRSRICREVMPPVGERMKLEFLVPARGLFGYRNEFLTDTRQVHLAASGHVECIHGALNLRDP